MPLKALVSEMLVWLGLNTPYSIPAEMPQVTLLPPAEIEAAICKNPCPVLAAYIPTRGILLNDSLDLDTDLCDRSILLHELVHFLQDKNRHIPLKTPLPNEEEAHSDPVASSVNNDTPAEPPQADWAWAEQEYEAYRYQNLYLSQNTARIEVRVPRNVRECRNQQRREMRQKFIIEHQRRLQEPY